MTKQPCVICDGLGLVAVLIPTEQLDAVSASGLRPSEERDAYLFDAWIVAESQEPSNDGWHHVLCPCCGGVQEHKCPAA